MSARPAIPKLNTPEHHFGAMFLILIARSPDDETLHAALRLAENAAVAAWALRPEGLTTLTVEQYRQLLDYTAASQVFDLALFLGGDRKQIRTLMDYIAGVMAEVHTRYPSPNPQA
ncbi:hypothetical protein ACIRVK_34595 [Streptomyces sp. NPDC101152]|uniref:hypothetical protein n=1 Tax=Streptomyces sp. NPDC101152 TaxID=3366116 RepID=UPI00382A0BA2